MIMWTTWARKSTLVLLLLMTGCKDAVLTGLTERQANEVIAVLEKYHIGANKQAGEKKQFNVLVQQQNMKQAIALISEHRLPSKEDVEIDSFFPTDALVASPRAEKARLISAIEQKLQQSLLRLDEAVDVRVHISYPIEDKNRLATQPEKRISVMVIHGTLDDTTIFANKIRLFVLNSFPDVKMENITVVLFAKHESQVLPSRETTSPRGQIMIITFAVTLMLLIIGGLWLRQRKKRDVVSEA